MAKKSSQTIVKPQIDDVPGVVQFEPCAAPLTKGRAVRPGEDKATYTLRHDDDRIFVYGVNDCRDHSEGTPRRLNSFERYTDSRDTDYIDLLKVQWLHLFAGHRGNSEAISPTGVLSVPISVYNDEGAVQSFKNKVAGRYEIEDAEGCQLRINIDEKRLIILPESVGDLYHFAYDHITGKPRGGTYDPTGNVVVVDVGFLTTDFSLHSNMKYQRQKDVTFTEPSMGMGKVTTAIHDNLNSAGNNYDISEIDAGLRAISGLDIGAPKSIFVSRQNHAEISKIYDPGIQDLAKSIADTIRNRYKIPLSLIVLAGGGAYHLHALLSAMLKTPVMICPGAAVANCLGAWTRLRAEAHSKAAHMPLLYAIDNGNGLSKGASSETLAGIIKAA